MSVPELAERIATERTHLWRVLTGKRPATSDLLARCLIGLGEALREQERRAS